eukprot:2007621-Pyramimonas_sp.AAC.2
MERADPSWWSDVAEFDTRNVTCSYLLLLLLGLASLQLASSLLGLDLGHNRPVQPVVHTDDASAEANNHRHHALERDAPAINARVEARAHLREVLHGLSGEDERHVGAETEKRVELLGLLNRNDL